MLPTASPSSLSHCPGSMARVRWGRLAGSALGAIAALTLFSPEARAQAQNPTQIAQTNPPIVRPAPVGSYIVAVPGGNDALLSVRRFYADAYLDSARQGSFVNVGSFFGRDSANTRASALRAQGLDARVLFRAVDIR